MSTTVKARPWWQRPVLRTDDDRSVGWLELFFDLVFVVVISRLAHHLAGDVTVHGVLVFALQFFGVFWIWNAFTYYAERFETTGLQDRLLTFLAILPVAALAVFAEGGLAEHYRPFAIAYLAARAVNMLEWARAAYHVPRFRPVAARFLLGFAVVSAVILVSFTAREELRLVLWTIAVVTDVATPAFTMRQQALLPPISTSKFPERFGLFTIIVLGESIVGVINGVGELSEEGTLGTRPLVVAGLGLAIGFALWWIYFDYIARRPPRPSITIALGWVYLHLVVVTTITITGVAVSAVIADSAHNGLQPPSQHLLAGGLAAALIALAALELTLAEAEHEPTHRVVSPGLKAAGGLIVIALGWAPLAWTSLGLTVALLLVLAVQMLYGAYVWFTRGPGATTV
jgi:low temperature requirement protein LtrA